MVGLVRKLRAQQEALEGYAKAAYDPSGDFMEYAAMRRRLSDLESAAQRNRRTARRKEAERSLRALRTGDIIRIPSGRHAGYAVVLDPGLDKGPLPVPLVLTVNRQVKRVSANDFPIPVEPTGRLRIPKSFSARSAQARRDLASALRSKLETLPTAPIRHRVRDGAPEDPEIAELRARIREHPCHHSEGREDRAAGRNATSG